MRSTLALYLLITSAAAQLFAHHDHTHHNTAVAPLSPAPATDAPELDSPAVPNDDPSPAIQTTSAGNRDSEQDFLRGLFGGTATTTGAAAATAADPLASSLQTPSTPEDASVLDPATLGIIDATTTVLGDTVAALTRSRALPLRPSRTALTPSFSTATAPSDTASAPTPSTTDPDLHSADEDQSTNKLSTLARAGITLGVFAGVALLIALMRWRRRLARALRSREEDLSWAADVEKYGGIAWPPSEPAKPAARPMTVLAAAPSAEIRLWEKLQHSAVRADWHAPRPGDIVRQSRMLLRSDTWASFGRPPAAPPLTELPPARKNTLTRATRNPTVAPAAAGRRNEPDLEEGVLRMLTR